MSNKQVIFTAADDNMINPMMVTWGSILRHGQVDNDVERIAFTTSNKKRRELATMGITNIVIDSCLTGASSELAPHQDEQEVGITLMLQALDFLKREGFERVTYIDSDAFVVGQIHSAMTVNLCGKHIGAVQDYYGFIPEIYQKDESLKHKLQPKFGGRYFNSGFFVMDIQWFYRDYLPCDTIAEFYRKECGEYQFFDQDCLNHVAKDWLDLPRKFNRFSDHAFTHPSGFKGLLAEPTSVVHMSGPQKPWTGYNNHYIWAQHNPSVYRQEVDAVGVFLDEDFRAKLRFNSFME